MSTRETQRKKKKVPKIKSYVKKQEYTVCVKMEPSTWWHMPAKKAGK